MVDLLPDTGRVPVVAIVGGGASGTLTALHLLRLAAKDAVSVHILLIDRYGRHGRGQAYATVDQGHLLNAPAAQMSALAADPDHLVRWAKSAGLTVSGTDFLPRPVYGRYLGETLRAAEHAAAGTATLSRVTASVVALTRAGLRRPLRVQLSGGGRLDADAVVLATGSPPPAGWPQVRCGSRFVPDPWAPDALAKINDGAPVLVIGTGLTMVDIATTVTAAHPRTVVYAVSRHGLLPRRHHRPPRHPHRRRARSPGELGLPMERPSLAELVRAVRRAVGDRRGDQRGAWQPVLDAMRPHIPALWAGLSIADRRRFLDLLARYWEVHRHRVPPATAERIAALQAGGRLRVLRGRLVSAGTEPIITDPGTTEPTALEPAALEPAALEPAAPGSAGPDPAMAAEGRLHVRLDAADGRERALRVGWVVNAAGPASDVRAVADALAGHLFEHGLARPDPLRLGLDGDGDGRVIDGTGRPHDRLFTLGPTLRGVLYETTAIPEIRVQAAALAPRLLAAVVAARVPRAVRPSGGPVEQPRGVVPADRP